MPAAHRYRGRRAAVIDDEAVRVTVLEEGGHIAEIFDKRSGVNPLWTPPWPSIEPSAYAPARHAEYGTTVEAPLLPESAVQSDPKLFVKSIHRALSSSAGAGAPKNPKTCFRE